MHFSSTLNTGHVCLTDFGLSKEGVTDISSGASSFCGTPEYLGEENMNNFIT